MSDANESGEKMKNNKDMLSAMVTLELSPGPVISTSKPLRQDAMTIFSVCAPERPAAVRTGVCPATPSGL
jgi:hypothetical protein